MNKILCPTDLTELGDTALDHAAQMGRLLGAPVTLFHVCDRSENDPTQRVAVEGRLFAQASRIAGQAEVDTLLADGDFMDGIAEESGNGYGLMVAGTYGPRGLRQHLFGADILKLVRHVTVPSWVMQRESPVRHLERLVMPVAGHADIHGMLDALCMVARAAGSHVHIYQLNRPGDEPSEQLLANKQRMMERLAAEGVAHTDVVEEPRLFSVGFAQQTIDYAQRIDAAGIVIMAPASDERRYLADAEKERLLTNEAHIPVLCCR